MHKKELKMRYEIEKLYSASLFLTTLGEDLEQNNLDADAQKLAEADLVAHIERLILVAQKLRGVKQDVQKARDIISQI